MNSEYFCPNLTFECPDDVDCSMCNYSIHHDDLDFDSFRMQDYEIALKTIGKFLLFIHHIVVTW
jgi:hypothetical protein